MQYNPFLALLIFLGIASLLFALFRPVKGWYWLLKNNWLSNEKTVMEDILKQLYRMESYGVEADINALTNSLKIKDGLIIETLHKMSVNELVKVEGDVLQLTKEGRQYAFPYHVTKHRHFDLYVLYKGFHPYYIEGFHLFFLEDLLVGSEHVRLFRLQLLQVCVRQTRPKL